MLRVVLFIWCAQIGAADTTSSSEAIDTGLSASTLLGSADKSSPSLAQDYRFNIYHEGNEETHSEQLYFGNVGTTLSLTFRAVGNMGQPLPGIVVTPIVASEPEGLGRKLEFSPRQGKTDASGELRLSVLPGDKPGKYEILFFQNPPPATGVPFRKFDLVAQDANWATLLILSLAGGLAIFLYGLKLASESLQSFAGNRLRSALANMTRNQILGVVLGIVITLFTQSSGATTIMLMSFVRAKLLSFKSSLGIVLGAAIGGTFTVLLFSFNLTGYALPAVAIGFVVYAFSKNPRPQFLGMTLLGFGLVFYGMKIMTDQMAPLKYFPFFRDAVEALGSHPIWAVILSTIFTAAAQSSGAILGVVLSLARQDLITLHNAIPIFFGASIGVCFTAFTSSVGAPAEAKRVAWAHLFYKVGAVLAFLPFIGLLDTVGTEFTQFSQWHPGMAQGEFIARAVANTFTLFTIVSALLTVPLIPLIERLCFRMIKEAPEYTSAEPRTKYLDHHVLDTPSAAMGSARREISRMGRFVEEMMKQIIVAILDKDAKVLEFIRQRDDKVDHLNTEITHYLTNLTRRTQNEAESNRAMDLLYIVSDLESIGDIVDKNLVPLAQKMVAHNFEFSEDGKKDLLALHHKVSEHLSQMVIALATSDPHLAEPVISGFASLQTEGKHFHLRHLQRLQDGLPESIETSGVHLDVINYLLRIDYLIFNISLHIAGKASQPNVIDLA